MQTTVYGNSDYYIAHNPMIIASLFMFVLFAEVDSPINLDDFKDIETINLDDCQDIKMEDEPLEQDNVSICMRNLFLNGSLMFNN